MTKCHNYGRIHKALENVIRRCDMILYVAADIMSNTIGVWHSLVVRLVRDQEAAGSNPVAPTKKQRVDFSTLCFLFYEGAAGIEKWHAV